MQAPAVGLVLMQKPLANHYASNDTSHQQLKVEHLNNL